MSIAKAIANLRIEKNYSQDNLAEKLFVSRDLVSKWETGARRPDWQMIQRIADVFEVSPTVIASKEELSQRELAKCFSSGFQYSVEELTEILNAFLKRLPETEANLFLERYYFLKSISEIASLFHVKENYVRSVLSRTRKKLKKYIHEVSDENDKTVQRSLADRRRTP